MTPMPVRIALILPFALVLAGPASAQDAARGAATDQPDAQALIAQHCVKCHGTEVYTRPDRKIGSLAALNTQVRWCETNLELRWFDEDIAAVTADLNDRFYHFKP